MLVRMQSGLDRSLHVIRAAPLALGAGDKQIIPRDSQGAGIPLRRDEADCGFGCSRICRLLAVPDVKDRYRIERRAGSIEISFIVGKSDAEGSGASRTVLA